MGVCVLAFLVYSEMFFEIILSACVEPACRFAYV
jgi:hypothetical protein